MSSVHSVLPPSSSGIWGSTNGCTAWVEMTTLFPDLETTIEAEEGEASHEIASELITQFKGGNTLVSFKQFDGKTATNGVLFTQEMFDGAIMYANHVLAKMRETGVFSDKFVGVERRLTMTSLHHAMFGTCDTYLFDGHRGHLYVWDYKFGYEVVEAFENWQGISYVAGIVELLGLDGLEEQSITVHIYIGQPRAFHVKGSIREWIVPLTTLRGYFNILRANAAIAYDKTGTTKTGSHCRHCSARHACQAALIAGMRFYEIASAPTPIEMSPAALGVQGLIINRALKQMEYLKAAYDEHIMRVIKNGTIVPNWTVEMGKGRDKWNKPVEEVIALGEILNVNLRKPDDVITPTQARNLGIDESVINAYSSKPSTGLKLIPDNGDRARQIFDN